MQYSQPIDEMFASLNQHQPFQQFKIALVVCNLLNQVDAQLIAIDVDSLLKVDDFHGFHDYVLRNQSQTSAKVHLEMDTSKFINNVVGSLRRVPFDQ